MKQLPEDLKDKPYAYYLGYTHAFYGLDLWYGKTAEQLVGLPTEFSDPLYAQGYEDGLRQ